MIPYTVYYNADGFEYMEHTFARSEDAASEKVLKRCIARGFKSCYLVRVEVDSSWVYTR